MTQAYSNPKRENDPYSLPDVEVFYISAEEFQSADEDSIFYDMYIQNIGEENRIDESDDLENRVAQDMEGFYYWSCLPGCMPDSDPIGPFETEAEAIADAQAESWQFEDSEEESEE